MTSRENYLLQQANCNLIRDHATWNEAKKTAANKKKAKQKQQRKKLKQKAEETVEKCNKSMKVLFSCKWLAENKLSLRILVR